MAWDINLDEVVAAGGQFGGPIATLRDSTKMVRNSAMQYLISMMAKKKTCNSFLLCVFWTAIMTRKTCDKKETVLWFTGGSKVVVTESGPPKLRFFSGSGVELGSIPWETSKKLLTFGWTETEELITIAADGTVNFYTLFGKQEHRACVMTGTFP